MTEDDERRAILLADVHSLFRTGMRYLLQELLSPVDVIEAGTRRDALARLAEREFYLVLAGLFTAEGEWESFLRELIQRGPTARVLILSGADDPGLIRRTLGAGASGYLLKETAPEIMVHAIRLVLAGGVYVPPAALGIRRRSGAHEKAVVASAEDLKLTARQDAVLRLLINGAANKEIARALVLSPGAVKAHVASLLRMFNATNRTELGVLAAQRGLPLDSSTGSRAERRD